MGVVTARLAAAIGIAALHFTAVAATAADKKLVPFAEDEPRETQADEPAKPRLSAPKKSAFEPRFKTPAVRQAQHQEREPSEASQPIAAASKAREESAGPSLQPIPMLADANDSPGRLLVDEAYEKSKAATKPDELTEVIELCRRGVKEGLTKGYVDYSRRLLGWSYNRRGEAQVEAGNEREALRDFEAAVENNPKSWRAVHNRGVSYAAAGRFKEALADFNRTIELTNKYPNAFFNRAELKYSQGDFAGAMRDYTAALAIKPGDPSVLNSRGHAFYRMQQFGEALRDYTLALKIDPHFAPALINRGDTYSDLGRYGEAATDYRTAVEAEPKLARAYQAAAWLMATCPDDHYRNDKLAVEAAGKAVALDGDDYRALETLAAAQANAGHFDEARKTQEKAIAKVPRGELVAAEKRMALYGRDLAYRERPSVAFSKPEDQPAKPDKNVRQASGTAPVPNSIPGPGRGRPVTRALR